ncbi:Wzz/FepE/Etk N-terminal domain-containing protein [Fructilactobacillus sanfranciscensis]|uniref:YveK family protein n=1 Tax=Fructilactobacillus sanfranciscensis TaxID=1625 RepID=UPI0031F83D9A
MENSLNESNFYKSLSVLKDHVGTIVLSTIICFFISAFLTFVVMKPKYSATTELLVNQKLSKNQLAIQAQQTQTDVQRVFTYKDIITSPVIQNTVSKDLKGQPGMPKKPKISVQSQQNSQVFSVTTSAENPYTAADIANDTAKVFQNKIKKIMDVNGVTVVSKAKPNLKPSSPHKLLNLIGGIIIGLLIGVFVSFFKEITDVKIRDIDYLKDTYGINNLGIITEIDDKDMKSLVSSNDGFRRNDKRRRV